MGAPGPHRGAGGLVVVRPSLKRVVPGSVPLWRAPCFAWPCRGFWLPGVFSWLRRGFLLPAARNRGAASEVASRSAIARFFPYYSSCYKNLLLKLFLQVETSSAGRRRNPAARGFSSMFKSLGLSARLRAVKTAFFDVGPTCCLCFSSGDELRDGSLAACSSLLAACCPPPARTAAAARNLLLVAARGCSCRMASAARPQIWFSILRRQLIEAGPS